MQQNECENSRSEGIEVKDEPTVENDYDNHPEIQSPNPSTATPPIPSEMPPR